MNNVQIGGVLLVLAGLLATPEQADGRWILRYDLTIDKPLETMIVALCFEDSTPRKMVIVGRDDFLQGPVRHRGGKRLPRAGSGFDSRALSAGDCVDYSVDLKRMATDGGGVDSAKRFGDTLLIRNGPWLLQPAVEFDSVDATVTVNTPKDTFHLLPWPAVKNRSNTYRLDTMAFVTHSQLAVGRTLELETLTVAGTTTRLGILGGKRQATRQGLKTWVAAAVEAVASVFGGTFPTPEVCVFAFPVIGLDSPVIHGYAQRGGGGHVLLYLNLLAKDHELVGEWVAIHELFHLAMPWVPESWLGEGMATWYGEVLRARNGHLSETKLWEILVDGFERGARSGTGRTLSVESDQMHKTRAYKRVYWAGAWFALALDVALRRGSGGKKTLDHAMVAVRKRFTKPVPVDALTFLAEIDRWYGSPLAVPMATRAMAETTFPDVEPLLAELGVVRKKGTITFDKAAPLARLRRSLSARKQP